MSYEPPSGVFPTWEETQLFQSTCAGCRKNTIICECYRSKRQKPSLSRGGVSKHRKSKELIVKSKMHVHVNTQTVNADIVAHIPVNTQKKELFAVFTGIDCRVPTNVELVGLACYLTNLLGLNQDNTIPATVLPEKLSSDTISEDAQLIAYFPKELQMELNREVVELTADEVEQFFLNMNV